MKARHRIQRGHMVWTSVLLIQTGEASAHPRTTKGATRKLVLTVTSVVSWIRLGEWGGVMVGEVYFRLS